MDNDQTQPQEPTTEPTTESTPGPSPEPTIEPNSEPSIEPTLDPSLESTPEPTNDTPLNPVPTKSKSSHQSHGAFIAMIVICILLSAVGIGLGVYNVMQINNLSNSVNSSNNASSHNTDQATNAFTGQDTSVSIEEVKCTPPINTEDVLGITIQNSPKTKFKITPNPGEIDFINYTTDESGNILESDNTVSSDVSEIINLAFQNTQGNLGDADYDQIYSTGADSLWYISLQSNTNNSECMIIGQDNPPAWFTTLVDMLEAKRNS